MNGAPSRELSVLPGGEPEPPRERPERPARDWLLLTVVALALIALIVAMVSSFSAGRGGVRALPHEQRKALLARTVDELRRTCGDARVDALRNHCRELASFAAQFEECRGDCESVVRRELGPEPTR